MTAERIKGLYAYRLPGTSQIICRGNFRDYYDNPNTENGAGFRICSFDGKQSFIINATEEQDLESLNLIPLGNTIYIGMRKGTYMALVEEIIEDLNADKAEKCVYAREIPVSGEYDYAATFRRLCESYPTAFVFAFYTPETGMWMGATPETLLSFNGEEVESMALAGTRQAHTGGDWDAKNLHEQRVVIDFICREFRVAGLEPVVDGPFTHEAGPVEHLCTGIKAQTTDSRLAFRLADSLSPTPALSGFPRKAALRMIEEDEPFDRGCYGGYCGPTASNGEFRYFVILRAMQCYADGVRLYSGGGIMADSNPEAEWEETERKAQTLLSQLVPDKDVSPEENDE